MTIASKGVLASTIDVMMKLTKITVYNKIIAIPKECDSAYSQYFSKKAFQMFTREELDLFMDSFVDEGSIVDIYDFKYRNEATLDYDIEDKLSNIKAKTSVTCSSDEHYFTPEFDIYPLKDKIENLKIDIFDAQDFVYKDDYSVFENLFREFFEEFKK